MAMLPSFAKSRALALATSEFRVAERCRFGRRAIKNLKVRMARAASNGGRGAGGCGGVSASNPFAVVAVACSCLSFPVPTLLAQSCCIAGLSFGGAKIVGAAAAAAPSR